MIEFLSKLRAVDPRKIAYRNCREIVTYGELMEEAEKTARALQEGGGGPFLLRGHKESAMAVGILACLMANVPYVPVDSALPEERVERIRRVLRDTPVPADTAYIIFTSGSTGEPKGVPVSRGNLANFIRWINGLYPLREYRDITVLNQASFAFDLSVADFYYAMSNGHTLAAMEREVQGDYGKMLRFVKESGASVAVMTPTFMKFCLLDREFNHAKLPLDCVFFCGERLETGTAKKLLSAFPELKILNAYGPTEATCAVSASLITADHLTEELLPAGEIGEAACEVELASFGDGTGLGEVILSGDSVAAGYLGGFPGGFYKKNGVAYYRTGDTGEIRAGRLYLHGRRDRQIKWKGYRIELDEIEEALGGFPEVKNCAVMAKRDSSGVVKRIHAYVVSDLPAEELLQRLARILPDYMLPRIVPMEVLPVNGNGKIDRRRLDEF